MSMGYPQPMPRHRSPRIIFTASPQTIAKLDELVAEERVASEEMEEATRSGVIRKLIKRAHRQLVSMKSINKAGVA